MKRHRWARVDFDTQYCGRCGCHRRTSAGKPYRFEYRKDGSDEWTAARPECSSSLYALAG